MVEGSDGTFDGFMLGTVEGADDGVIDYNGREVWSRGCTGYQFEATFLQGRKHQATQNPTPQPKHFSCNRNIVNPTVTPCDILTLEAATSSLSL